MFGVGITYLVDLTFKTTEGCLELIRQRFMNLHCLFICGNILRPRNTQFQREDSFKRYFFSFLKTVLREFSLVRYRRTSRFCLGCDFAILYFAKICNLLINVGLLQCHFAAQKLGKLFDFFKLFVSTAGSHRGQ